MDSTGAATPVDDGFEKVGYDLEVLVKKRLSDKEMYMVEVKEANVTDNKRWRRKNTKPFSDVVKSVVGPAVRCNETCRGNESVTLENIKSVLLRDEAVSPSNSKYLCLVLVRTRPAL